MMQTTKKRFVCYFWRAARKYNTSVAAVVDANSDVKLKPWKEIPGPKSYPIIGPLLSFLPGRRLADINVLQDNFFEMYGPIVRVDAMLGRPPILFIFDPKVIEFLYRSEDKDPVRRALPSLEYYRKRHKKSVDETKPTGLSTEQNEQWKTLRSTVNPVFLPPKTIILYKAAMDTIADDMIKRMRQIRNENDMLDSDFLKEMNLWSLESLGVIVLGGRLQCIDKKLPENSPEKRLLNFTHDTFEALTQLDFGLSLWRYFPTPGFKKAMKLFEEQEALLQYFIRKARKEMLTNNKTDEEKGVLEKLLEIDEGLAVTMASEMLFGGGDTGAITITTTLYLLAKNQDKQDKLREALNSGTDSRTYLRACLKESIRMLPVTLGNLRAATKEYNIHGYRVPKDTSLIFGHQLLSSMDSQFPRAKEYIPERWIEPGELYYKSAHPFAYRPFGFGTRMCIGMRISDLELESFLTKIIQNFKVEWFGPPLKIEQRILNRPRGPFNFKFKDLVYRSENSDPVRLGFGSLEYYRKRYNKQEDPSKPTGLITDQHEVWKKFRSTVNPVLLQPKTIKLYKSAIDQVADDMIKRMRSLRNENNIIDADFNAEMNLWSLESVGVIALGGRLNCFDQTLPEDSPEKRLIACVHNIFKAQNDLDLGLSLWQYFPTPGFKKAMKIYAEQESLTRHFIERARKEMLTNEKTDEEKGVLEKLLEIDERLAIIMASDMLVAGVDTTSITIIQVLYLLAKNQDKQDKLREVLNRGIESRRYLRACIKEGIRILPVVSGTMRFSTKEYNLLGYRIPKDTFIIFNHQLLSKMDSHFPKANEYIPERWIEPGELSYKNAHPFAYNPFGFGTRMCIGRRIAELELESFLAKLITNFKVEWFGPPPKIEVQSINFVKGPFNFTFKDL